MTNKATVTKPLLVLLSLFGGFLAELANSYLVHNYHWTISQPLTSAIYSALCVSLFFLFSKTYSKRIAALSIMSGAYGFLLLITLDGTYYTLLNGIIWHNSINFQLLYRAVEVFIIVRLLWDASNYLCRLFSSNVDGGIDINGANNKNAFSGVS